MSGRAATRRTRPLRFTGPGGWVDGTRRAMTTFPTWSDRLRGVEDAAGHRIPAGEAASGMIDEGERAGHALLALPDRPTAIVTQSDLLAVGVVRAARATGLRVPEDISVAGFDGIDTPWVNSLELATVEQPKTAKGRAAVRMVTQLLAGTMPEATQIPITVRSGTTTAPPPRRSWDTDLGRWLIATTDRNCRVRTVRAAEDPPRRSSPRNSRPTFSGMELPGVPSTSDQLRLVHDKVKPALDA